MRKAAYFDEYYIEFEGEGKDYVVISNDGELPSWSVRMANQRFQQSKNMTSIK